MDYINELYSWRKFLSDLFPGVLVLEERDVGLFARPSFRLEESAHVAEPTGGRLSGYLDNRTMQIVYFANNFDDALSKESIIYEKLMRDKIIQGYMEDFVYPKPLLKVVTANPSTIGGKTVFIRTTGLIEGKETLAAEETIVVPAGNNGVLIRANRFPLSYPWFSRYNVYVNEVVDTPLLLGTLDQPAGKLWAELTVSNLGVGAAAPTTSEVKFRNITVLNMTTSRREDEIVDGVWNAFFSISTQSLGFILHDQSIETVKTVTIAEEVS